jgi:c-di-GMP-binding flagellar brake protein YcgR
MFIYYGAVGRCIWWEEAPLKKLRVRKVDLSDGDIHFVLDESLPLEESEYFRDSSVVELKRISKEEAKKILVLFREE